VYDAAGWKRDLLSRGGTISVAGERLDRRDRVAIAGRRDGAPLPLIGGWAVGIVTIQIG